MKSVVPKPPAHFESFALGRAVSATSVEAAHTEGPMAELVARIDAWLETERDRGLSDASLAELCVAKAASAPAPYARELCRAALDLVPAHAAALALFEQLVDASERDELCARYLAFLEDAPFCDVPPRVRAAVLEKLIRAEDESASQR